MATNNPSIVTRFYYNVKPFVPRRVRWALRRQHALGTLEKNLGVWPINQEARVIPNGWKGWPKGKRFAFVLTHDVETANGLAKVRNLADLETKFGLCSSFNFIPKGDYPVPDELRFWLAKNNFEVGVHDLHHDGKLFRSRGDFNSHAQQINEYLEKWGAVGFRAGFMLRQLDWIQDLDIEYDASTFDTDPFEPQGDGCRTIFPYFMKNTRVAGKSGYVELPYTLPQDSTLYLLLRERSPEIWLRKLDWIAENGGMALVNIHPDYMDFQKADYSSLRYPASLVETLLEHLQTRYAGEFWNPLPRDLAKWYRQSHCETPGPAGSCPTFDSNSPQP